MKDKTHKKIKNFFFYDFVKITGIIPAMLIFHPKVIWTDKSVKKTKGKVLIIANHNSFLDPIIVMLSWFRRRIVFMATEDLFASRLGKRFFEHVHCIPVNKENFNMNSFRLVSENLNDGRVVALFPEGSVDTQTKELHVFKSGAVLMALKNDAPVLPVYMPPKVKGKRRTVVVGNLINLAKISCGEQTEERTDEQTGDRTSESFGMQTGRSVEKQTAKPTVAKIEKCSAFLYEKELNLSQIYKNEILKRFAEK